MDRLSSGGGTSIITALREMFNVLKTMKRNIQFVLLTDAEDSCSQQDVQEMIGLRDEVANTLKANGFDIRRFLYLLHAGGMKKELETIFGTKVKLIKDGDLKKALEKSAKIAQMEFEIEENAGKINAALAKLAPKQDNFIQEVAKIDTQVM